MENGIGGRGPYERPLVPVVLLGKALDVGNELAHVSERASTDGLLRNQAKPAFNLIEPTRVGRREMHVVARMLGQPCLDLRMLVCRIVIDDQMHIEISRYCLVNMPEKRQEFLMSMAWLALCDDLTRCCIERGKQGRGAMPAPRAEPSLATRPPLRRHARAAGLGGLHHADRQVRARQTASSSA